MLFSALPWRLTPPYGMIQKGAVRDHSTSLWGWEDARRDHSRVHDQEVLPRALYLVVSLPPDSSTAALDKFGPDIIQRLGHAVATAIHAMV
jgi:hypothetical protein